MSDIYVARQEAARERVLNAVRRYRGLDPLKFGDIREQSYRRTLSEEKPNGIDEHYDWCRAMVNAWSEAKSWAMALDVDPGIVAWMERQRDIEGNTGD